MKAHYFQHVPFEDLGSIETWLKKTGYQISATRFFEQSSLPDPEMIDLLIIMGGPMSVNDESEFSWLIQEKQFIRQFINLRKPVLGICLGAQLIVSAMGGTIYKNREKEIGWYPIQGIKPNNKNEFCFPETMTVFHWHGETFDLPPGATLLARSDGCDHQAFQINTSVIGLQFHLETTPESAVQLVSNCGAELVQSRYIQSETDILSVKPEIYESINKLMGDILQYLTR